MSPTPRRVCGCGTPLARDNQGPRCGPCQAAAAQHLDAPPQVPAEFWQDPEIMDACAREHIGRVIRAWRTNPWHGRRRISQEVAAAWFGLDQSGLSRVELGQPISDLERLRDWAYILQIPRDLAWFRLRPSPLKLDQSVSGATSSRTVLPDGAIEPTSGHQQEFAERQASLERQIAAMVRRSVDFARSAQSGSIPEESVAQLHDDLRYFSTKFVGTSVFDMVGELAEFQDAMFGTIEDQRHPVPAIRVLYFSAAVTTGLLAHALKDLGRTYEATAFARTVYACGEAADHPGVMAWARGELSLIAFRQRNFVQALKYSEAATKISERLRGSTAMWAWALQARAHASLGDYDRALSAVSSLRRARDIWTPDDLDRVGGLFEFSEPKQSYYLAGTYADISGSAQLAEGEALEALSYYSQSESYYATAAGTRCELALARVHRQEFEGALEALEPVFELPPVRRVTGIIDSLGRVRAALIATASQDPLAQSIDREIVEFCRYPVTAMVS
jgi:tetratricopeptide (TPR) repeat protein